MAFGVFLKHLGKNMSRHPSLTIATSAFMAGNLVLESARLKKRADFLNKIWLTVRVRGMKILCRLPDLVIVSDVFLVDEYSALKPDKNSVIFDIGANIGVFTLKASRWGQSVVSIEPSSENFEILQKNIQMNGVENVMAVKTAVSDRNGHIEFFVDRSSGGESSAFRHSENMKRIRVKSIKLDDLVKKLHLNLSGKKIVIKMDVEGSELNVLRGASNLLKNRNVQILMETHPKILNPKRVEDLLKSSGFRIRHLDYNQPFMLAEKGK